MFSFPVLNQHFYDFNNQERHKIMPLSFKIMDYQSANIPAFMYPEVPITYINQKIETPNIRDIKQEAVKIKDEETNFKLENFSPSTYNKKYSQNAIVQVKPKPLASNQPNLDKYFNLELQKMVTFILLCMGKNDQMEIETFRKTYLHNACLLQVYDKLVIRYFSAKKCKEDITRYILRKVFKMIRTSIMKKEKVSSQKASLILCKRYFKRNFERIQQQSQMQIENDTELLEHFMPYNKKSVNKTMNSSFIAEIFSSEEFCNEYEKFLSNFSNILRVENNKKKEKLIKYIIECIKDNSIQDIAIYSRFPWLDSWVEETKNLAYSLLVNKNIDANVKKAKIDGNKSPCKLANFIS